MADGRPTGRRVEAPRMAGTYPRRPAVAVAAAILAIVVIASGGLTYALLAGSEPNESVVIRCDPATACASLPSIGPGLRLSAPSHSVFVGSPVPISVQGGAGPGGAHYTFFFGDGNNTTTEATTVSHIYQFPGDYLLSVSADLSGAVETNDRMLEPLEVLPSYSVPNATELPEVEGNLVANSTNSTDPTALVPIGGYVNVSGEYSFLPVNPDWTEANGTFQGFGGNPTSIEALAGGGWGARFVPTVAGADRVVFVGRSVDPSGGVAIQEYEWTVFAAPPSVHPGLAQQSLPVSPHPGSLLVYEDLMGNTDSFDPALSPSTEPVLNVYQTLIRYNGSQTGDDPEDYLPDLATCVPGSAECTRLYDTSLVSGTNYTFVVSSSARFYDPATGASWKVYPTDVLFSLVRTLAFSVVPCVTCNVGWVQAQALLSPGNGSWDGGIHGPFNTTPAAIFDSMTINESGYCTGAMLSVDDGCLTLHANGSGEAWPFLFQLLSDPAGGSITPCGWFSAPAQGAGIPYWTLGNVTGAGDHPCAAPGAPGAGVPPPAMPPTGWDAWEVAAQNPPYPGTVNGMVGSGPYYLSDYSLGQSVTYRANPAYAPNPDCLGPGCPPPVGAYAATVYVIEESDPEPGEQALESGIADYASVPSTDFAFLAQEIEAGRAIASPTTSFTIFGAVFILDFDRNLTGEYSTSPVTVPEDWFSYPGVRQFFVRAYPYASIQRSVNTVDGFVTGLPYGGAIPRGVGDYYPSGIDWPSTDPCDNASSPVCPTYWWAQLQNASSPYYDPEVADCTVASPCVVPVFSFIGAPDLDERMSLWGDEIETLSGNRLQMPLVDLSFDATAAAWVDVPPGTAALPLAIGYNSPDYADPSDYAPLYLPDSFVTWGAAEAQQFSLPMFNNSASCPAPEGDYNLYANQTGAVANQCQGPAYWSMVAALRLAANLPPALHNERVRLYAVAESIANLLGLYVYLYQDVGTRVVGPWIDPGSLNSNPLYGGESTLPWYSVQGRGVDG